MNRKTPITSYLDLEDVEQLERIGRESGKSLSELIRTAVKSFLKEVRVNDEKGRA